MITAGLNVGFYTRIDVYEHSDDFLSAKKWVFTYKDHDHNLEVDTYLTVERKTKRHKYQIVDAWIKSDKRGSNLDSYPPIPEDVKQAALEKFSSTINVL